MRFNTFEYMDRGHARTLVLVPGWGFDVRIFKSLDLNFNYLLVHRIDTERFNADLIRELGHTGIKKVSLFGWSMGGFLSLNFLKEYKGVVREVFLISMRKKFPREQIDSQRAMLIEDQRLYLTRFYRNCFMGHKHAFEWFKEHLLSSYMEIFDLASLLKGLDYLAEQELDTVLLNEYPVWLIHGKRDRIAPCSEIREFALPRLLFFEKGGHLPFLESDFKERLYAYGI